MIEIQIKLNKGCIQSIEARGHAPKEGAVSLSCGIVSSVLKALALSIHERDIQYTGVLEKPGYFELSVVGSWRADLLGISTMVLSQLDTVQESWPTELQIYRKES